MRGVLKSIEDAITKSEREIIANLGVAREERKRAFRRAEDERWLWIVAQATDTAVKPLSPADLLLGRES